MSIVIGLAINENNKSSGTLWFEQKEKQTRKKRSWTGKRRQRKKDRDKLSESDTNYRLRRRHHIDSIVEWMREREWHLTKIYQNKANPSSCCIHNIFKINAIHCKRGEWQTKTPNRHTEANGMMQLALFSPSLFLSFVYVWMVNRFLFTITVHNLFSVRSESEWWGRGLHVASSFDCKNYSLFERNLWKIR